MKHFMKDLMTHNTLGNLLLVTGFTMVTACSQAVPEQTQALEPEQVQVSQPEQTQVFNRAGMNTALPTSLHVVDVHKPWPAASEISDIEVADNLFGEHYVIAIDTSGSMDGNCEGANKLVSAKSAAIEFLSNIPQDASVGLAIFGSRVGMLVPLDFNNHANVESAISNLSAGGGTPMSRAIEDGYKSLVEAGNAQLGYGNYNLVILGDGEPQSVSDTKKELDKIAHTTPVNVTTIGFCADISVLDRIAVNYQPASNAAELRMAFATVLAEAAEIDGNDF